MDSTKLYILLLACYVFSCTLADNVTFVTKLGNITGTAVDLQGSIVNIFQGIPYAKAPVGDLRFAKPESYGKFIDGKLDATSFGPICAQLNGTDLMGSEDCLFLNVFAPAYNSTDDKKSVMIWIHGGSNIGGSSNQYPAHFLSMYGDVVIVTINYRLNAFGFLSTGDSDIPGNYGLWDQWLAIRWVKENIADYGGSTSSITLFGESAGGFDITYQMMSPHNNETVFQRAITESGSGFALATLNYNPKPVTSAVGLELGCLVKEDLLKCLRSKSMDELLGAMKTPPSLPDMYFAPVADDDFLPTDLAKQLKNFMTDSYSKNMSISMGSFAEYDILSGWNNQEGLLLIKTLEQVNKMLTGKNLTEGVSADALYISLLLGIMGTRTPDSTLLVDIFIDYYMNTPEKLQSYDRSDDERRMEAFANIIGHVHLVLPTIQHLQLHSAISSKNTYAYEFIHKRSTPALWYEGPDWLRFGADHADEIVYVFGIPFSPNNLQLYSSAERELSGKMMKQWTNFAKTGNPGDEYEPFTFPRNQTYTVLKTGGLVKQTYPLNGEQRMWTAVTLATEKQLAESSDNGKTAGTTNDTTAGVPSSQGSRSYLSGMLTLTGEEADQVMTGILVVAVLLAVLSVILIISLVSTKCKAARNKAH